jgi:hypothetical protein
VRLSLLPLPLPFLLPFLLLLFLLPFLLLPFLLLPPDPTKFRIFSGLKKSGAGNFGWRGALQLRAESSADRQRWINILNEMKSHYKTKELLQDGMGQSTGGDDDMLRLEEQLQGLNASASVIEVVRTWAATKEEAHEEVR